MLIHCGDTCGSDEYYRNSLSCPVVIVRGNNDYAFGIDKEALLTVGTHRIFVTHGHGEGVYFGKSRLSYKAASLGADIVLFGHTHVPYNEYDEVNKVHLLNPGSLSYPRQYNGKPSYMVLEIGENEELQISLKYC